MARQYWSDEKREAELRRLWAGGCSAAVIAQRMTSMFQEVITRNAVIGKSHRLGLDGRVSRIKKSAPRRRRAAHPWKPKAVAKQKSTPKDPTFPVDLIPSRPLRTLEQLNGRTCRWPYGDPKERGFGFCGRDCDLTVPYCEVHAEQAVRP